MSKLIFRARSQMLDIKTQQSWKYAGRNVIGYKIEEESVEELVTCQMLNT